MNRLLTAAALLCFLAACSNPAPAPADIPAATAPSASKPKDGKVLFMDNCSQCHRLQRDMTGPALAGALDRWKSDTTKLVRFIRNSQQVIAEGDAYAEKLYNTWAKTQMPANTHLSEEEVKKIISYIAAGQD